MNIFDICIRIKIKQLTFHEQIYEKIDCRYRFSLKYTNSTGTAALIPQLQQLCWKLTITWKAAPTGCVDKYLLMQLDYETYHGTDYAGELNKKQKRCLEYFTWFTEKIKKKDEVWLWYRRKERGFFKTPKLFLANLDFFLDSWNHYWSFYS